MLTCLFVLKLLKGRLRAAGPPAGESGPPGPWIHLPRNLEYFKELAVAEGGYVELEQFDSDGGRRGTALWQVDHIIEKKKEGLWLQARLVAATDEHLQRWLKKGPGQGRITVVVLWSTCAQRLRAGAAKRNVAVNENFTRTRSVIYHRATSYST